MLEECLDASDGQRVQLYKWPIEQPKAIVHIAHGMGEHARRYDWVATQLNAAGYSVVANDHRGHGATAALCGHPNGYMGPDGWNRVLADAFEINRHARMGNDCPLVLLGHSMGSMMAQQYVTRYGSSIDALVLSGSPGFKNPVLNLIPRIAARIESKRLGADQASDVLQNLLFGSSNKNFDAPDATGFEWLSRDPEEVGKYVDDEACGFVLTCGSLVDLFAGARAAQEFVDNIPTDLPVYVFSGSDDPVHSEQQDLNRLVDAYRRHGITKLEYKLYPGGRHEMFNETNRDEVVGDLINWLAQNVG